MRRQDGFTLVEVLVGVALFGLILAALLAGAGFVAKAEQAQIRVLARTGDLDGVERVVRRLIAQANPGAPNTEPLHGTADRVSFTTVLPEPETQAMLNADAALLLEGPRLILRWRRHGIDGAPREATLLADVSSLRVAYLGLGWQDGWDSPDPPALVRIRVTFPAGDARHWPDLVVAPVRRRPR